MSRSARRIVLALRVPGAFTAGLPDCPGLKGLAPGGVTPFLKGTLILLRFCFHSAHRCAVSSTFVPPLQQPTNRSSLYGVTVANAPRFSRETALTGPALCSFAANHASLGVFCVPRTLSSMGAEARPPPGTPTRRSHHGGHHEALRARRPSQNRFCSELCEDGSRPGTTRALAHEKTPQRGLLPPLRGFAPSNWPEQVAACLRPFSVRDRTKPTCGPRGPTNHTTAAQKATALGVKRSLHCRFPGAGPSTPS